ncbi:MAG TPA: NAD(P)-dependent alcohol dehydrogenase [Rhodoglobus sp.]|nr:NAD(P)-dependent alcohol dehydrogenase [Rhodoglobus sp.]
MRAIWQDRYGDADALRYGELPEPEPREGRVLVRVKAAGVNMADWHLMTGRPLIARLALGLTRPKERVRGQDLAGIVERVGEGVTAFAPGDEVFGSGSGAFAELALARAENLVAKPVDVSFEDAAAAPIAGYTALQALRAVGDLHGRTVVVTGAGGGVGSFLVQLAKRGGARVIAVCSAGKAGLVRSLDADEVVDYATADVTRRADPVDAVLDFAGGRSVRDWKRILRPGGVLVQGGNEEGGDVLGPVTDVLRSRFVRGIRVVSLLALVKPDDLDELARLLGSGELRPPVARTYPLEETARAIDDLRAARYPGKLVIVP